MLYYMILYDIIWYELITIFDQMIDITCINMRNTYFVPTNLQAFVWFGRPNFYEVTVEENQLVQPGEW